MFKVSFHPAKARCKITKIIVSIILFISYGCQSTQLTLRKGQDTQLHFPYPCNSSEVTIQYGYKAPFYRLTDGSLSQDQANRFRVENRTENGNCFLELTIRNLMRNDAGTYISSVYRDGQLIVDLTTRVGLQIEYPPGKATCVKEENKGGGWVTMECTADVGSISGKIECYQNGEKMPSLTDPVETYTTLTEIILIRETQPAFCCSSTLYEDKTKCECNDTVLNPLDDSVNDPCPPSSLTTTMPFVYNVTENNPTDHYSTMTSYTSKMMKDDKCNAMIIHSILGPIEVILLLMSLFIHYKMKTKTRTKGNDNEPPKFSVSLLKTTNGSIRENGIMV